jgi:glycosyltransferase involved in cell wall biosynthesis
MGMTKNQEFRRELESTVQALGLGEMVQFDGFVADTESVMKEHDVILNFSEAESFSLTCLDALYYGVPLIASDCGGPAELFEDGRSGFLVPNRDVPAMAAAISRLTDDVALRRQFSMASRQFVRQKFARLRPINYWGIATAEFLRLRKALRFGKPVKTSSFWRVYICFIKARNLLFRWANELLLSLK